MQIRFSAPAGIAIAVCLSVFFWGWYFSAVPLVISQPYDDGTVLRIERGQSLQQTFVARYPGLSQIRVRAARGSPVELERARFTLLVGAGPSRQVAVQPGDARIEAQEGGWISIGFEPQPHPPPTEYAFLLENEGTEPLALRADGRNLYPAGSASTGPFDLAFQAVFALPLRERLFYLLRQIARGKPGIFGVPSFYAALGVSMTTLLSASLLSLLFQAPGAATDADIERRQGGDD